MAKLNKEQVAMNLLTCSSLNEAAEKSGVSVSTLYRLRKQPSFQKILNRVKDEIFNDAMQKAQGYTLESLEVLRTVMKDSAATDSSRVSAARTILELGLNAYEQETILQKIDELESRLFND